MIADVPKTTARYPDHEPLRRRAILVSLLVGVLMLGGKWAAYLLTGSHAILSDALESIVHILAIAFAFASILLSARPPDPNYPYGYGKIAYFSAGFEGGLIVLASLAIFYEAVRGLFRGEKLEHLDWGLALIVAAVVINVALGWWLVHLGRKTQSLILVADGQHVLADAYTSLGVVIGVALVWLTEIRWLDPLVAILVGLNILRTGYSLVREGARGLMDRADPVLLNRIVEALQAARRPDWNDIHQLRAWQAGDRTFVDFHLVVPPDRTVVQLHESHDRAREALRAALGPATEIVIHFDPDVPERSVTAPNSSWTVESAVRIPFDNDHPSVIGGSIAGDAVETAKIEGLA